MPILTCQGLWSRCIPEGGPADSGDDGWNGGVKPKPMKMKKGRDAFAQENRAEIFGRKGNGQWTV